MITCCDTQDFIPFGRDYVRQHPGQFQVKRKSGPAFGESSLPIVKSFNEISLRDSEKKEDWVFRIQDGEDVFDEELYVRGHTVVWSRGSQENNRKVVKTFTMDTPVLQVLWGSFILTSDQQSMDAASSMGASGKEQQGVCIVESSTLSFFLEGGGDYSTPLPFQVLKTWSIQHGLLFERSLTHTEMKSPKKNCPSQTVMFSMLHPLDDVAPVITKTPSGGGNSKVSYLSDINMKVILTCTEPSIALTYDSVVGLHSLWKIRKARQDEISQLKSELDSTSFLHMTPGGLNLSSSFSKHNLSNSFTGANNSSNLSPLRGFTSKVMSPGGVLRASPSIGPMAAKTHSPAMSNPNSSSVYRFHTPPHRSPSMLLRTPSYPPSAANGSFFGADSSFLEPTPIIQPAVCFDQIWTETVLPVRDGQLGKASKAFLSKDWCGQQYLCFLVPYRQQLRCLKFETSNDGSQLICGSVTDLQAKDATPIQSQSLLLVLEMNGSLILYSGTTRICQVHIPLLSMGSGSLSILRPAITPMGSPTRGDVLTSSRPPSAMAVRFDDEMVTHISPVSANLEDSMNGGHLEGSVPLSSCFIQGLRDNVGKKFSVELLNGSMCRTELPSLSSSPGISLCLQALKHLLPSDIALQVLGRWYTTRNAPGAVGNIAEWEIFTKCILALMGFDTGKLALTSKIGNDGSASPTSQSKRARPSDQGTDEDWRYLLESDHHSMSSPVHRTLGLKSVKSDKEEDLPSCPCGINKSAILYPFCPAVLMALHLVYEEMKLNVLMQEELAAFAPLIHQIASDLRCWDYVDYYRREFPQLFTLIDDISQIREEDLSNMQYPSIYPHQVSSVTSWISTALSAGAGRQAPMIYIPLVCEQIRKVISIYSLMVNEELSAEMCIEKCLKKMASAGHRAPTTDLSMSFSLSKSLRQISSHTQAERLVIAMTELGFSQRDIDCLPVGISLPLREACLQCRSSPPSDWPQSAYTLIGREDLSKLASLTPNSKCRSKLQESSLVEEEVEKEVEDGMDCLDEEVLKLRFPKDLRLQEVRRLLQSARPVTISIKQRPEVSDHDFIEEQEKALLAISIRTMALPVGRGMFTLHTCQPLLTETLPVPKLCLTGRAPPRNTTVDLNRIDVPSNMSVWPEFHNGVAAGLRIADSTQIDSAWIIYNKPKDLTNEFAGFLMALGLNGHLPNLNTFNIHEYLSEGNELITIGILLGMSAARRGSMDLTITKALSVHVSALLPPTSTELNIAHNIRVAAIMGVGLLYQGTGHLHMAEVMLAEIGRPPGPEMENCVDRDSYALSAGLALGLIMFGKGNQMTGLSDLSMADILYHLMVGGHTKQMLWPQRDRTYKAPSFLIKEGDSVNVDVTSPGATLALGMIFFNTQNSAVSEWLKAPDTQFMLDQVRPDFLCLRTISHGLVNWDHVLPSANWVAGNIPEIVKKYAFYKPRNSDEGDLDPAIDLQTMSQAYCSITGGACLVMALKFAGSGNSQAFKTLLDSLRGTLKMLGDQTLLEQAGRSTVENCISIKLLALAIVMAGTGDLVTLRICRALRCRVGSQFHQSGFGNHMCNAMATGLLFLGGGKFTLKTSPEAIGAMLCAFYPHFPLTSSDNRYHLQAFRHLYVLACEPRLIIPRDVDTGKFCYVPLRIKFKGCPAYKSVWFDAGAPYIVPELDKLEEVQVLCSRYWPITFRCDKNWDLFKLLLQKGGVLDVKQRAGHLSYMEDPKGYRGLLAKSLTADHSCHLSSQVSWPDVIKSFTSDARVTALAEFFIKSELVESSMLQELSAVIYHCVTREKTEAISPYFILRHIGENCMKATNTLALTQLRLVLTYYNSPYRLTSKGEDSQDRLLHSEFLISLRCGIESHLDQWAQANPSSIVDYLQNPGLRTETPCYGLAHYLVWFQFPSQSQLSDPHLAAGCPPLPVLASLFPRLDVSAVMRLHALMSTGSPGR